MIEIKCDGCGKIILIKQTIYNFKKGLGQSKFYHKQCYRPAQAWKKREGGFW